MTSTSVTVLETQIDDLNPQAIGYLFDRLFEQGALDVFTQAIGMKKSRPGILLTVIALPEEVPKLERLIFTETTTLGIRRTEQERTVLDRRFEIVTTPHGPISIKLAYHQGELLNVQPEYEDCAAIARQHSLPWREIHRLAIEAWYAQ
jgi:pyridinium-3,5-bisthiocarboxylic acid mononucleotide nickel chelatase